MMAAYIRFSRAFAVIFGFLGVGLVVKSAVSTLVDSEVSVGPQDQVTEVVRNILRCSGVQDEKELEDEVFRRVKKLEDAIQLGYPAAASFDLLNVDAKYAIDQYPGDVFTMVGGISGDRATFMSSENGRTVHLDKDVVENGVAVIQDPVVDALMTIQRIRDIIKVLYDDKRQFRSNIDKVAETANKALSMSRAGMKLESLEDINKYESESRGFVEASSKALIDMQNFSKLMSLGLAEIAILLHNASYKVEGIKGRSHVKKELDRLEARFQHEVNSFTAENQAIQNVVNKASRKHEKLTQVSANFVREMDEFKSNLIKYDEYQGYLQYSAQISDELTSLIFNLQQLTSEAMRNVRERRHTAACSKLGEDVALYDQSKSLLIKARQVAENAKGMRDELAQKLQENASFREFVGNNGNLREVNLLELKIDAADKNIATAYAGIVDVVDKIGSQMELHSDNKMPYDELQELEDAYSSFINGISYPHDLDATLDSARNAMMHNITHKNYVDLPQSVKMFTTELDKFIISRDEAKENLSALYDVLSDIKQTSLGEKCRLLKEDALSTVDSLTGIKENFSTIDESEELRKALERAISSAKIVGEKSEKVLSQLNELDNKVKNSVDEQDAFILNASSAIDSALDTLDGFISETEAISKSNTEIAKRAINAGYDIMHSFNSREHNPNDLRRHLTQLKADFSSGDDSDDQQLSGDDSAFQHIMDFKVIEPVANEVKQTMNSISTDASTLKGLVDEYKSDLGASKAAKDMLEYSVIALRNSLNQAKVLPDETKAKVSKIEADVEHYLDLLRTLEGTTEVVDKVSGKALSESGIMAVSVINVLEDMIKAIERRVKVAKVHNNDTVVPLLTKLRLKVIAKREEQRESAEESTNTMDDETRDILRKIKLEGEIARAVYDDVLRCVASAKTVIGTVQGFHSSLPVRRLAGVLKKSRLQEDIGNLQNGVVNDVKIVEKHVLTRGAIRRLADVASTALQERLSTAENELKKLSLLLNQQMDYVNSIANQASGNGPIGDIPVLDSLNEPESPRQVEGSNDSEEKTEPNNKGKPLFAVGIAAGIIVLLAGGCCGFALKKRSERLKSQPTHSSHVTESATSSHSQAFASSAEISSNISHIGEVIMHSPTLDPDLEQKMAEMDASIPAGVTAIHAPHSASVPETGIKAGETALSSLQYMVQKHHVVARKLSGPQLSKEAMDNIPHEEHESESNRWVTSDVESEHVPDPAEHCDELPHYFFSRVKSEESAAKDADNSTADVRQLVKDVEDDLNTVENAHRMSPGGAFW